MTDIGRIKEAFVGFAGEIRFNEPMHRYTSFKIGGEADAMIFPEGVDDLKKAVLGIKKHRMPFFVMGKGTNLLVLDGGIRGIVINLRSFRKLSPLPDNSLYAGAGTQLQLIARHAAGMGLSGLEFTSGIPGSLGGAIVMNAGANGGEIGPLIRGIRILDMDGEVRDIKGNRLRFGYRSSCLPQGIIISAELGLKRSEKTETRDKGRHEIIRRGKTQPLSLPNAGSVFKNPPGDYAGRLIEEAGLKGLTAGDAQVSPLHANFIVNMGRATARDVLALIRMIGKKVETEKGITLELEIKVVGNNKRGRV
ncbi:MAG TPA: UDP-N-acetylmuramate dehydrogenase [Nitrospiria bacterium]|nr:UDP-N-acetylmuramate dehydrogenase [Nitrospiria bacterium]